MTLEDLASAHRRLSAEVADLYAQRAALIQRARADGHTWAEIADALDMTTHGAIKASRMSTQR